MEELTAFLFLLLGTVSCQRTTSKPGACIYSFMVPQPLEVSCSGSNDESPIRADLLELDLQVQQLKRQHDNLVRRMQELEEGSGAKYPLVPSQGDGQNHGGGFPFESKHTYVMNGEHFEYYCS